MFNSIQWLFLRLRSETLKLFILAGVLLLLWGTLSPVGTLVWWLSQSAETLGLKKSESELIIW